ncbi:MAG: phenylphosphate carboxylase subunit delta [bacterium]
MPVLLKDLTCDQRAALVRARLFVLDVDGTLTDGQVVYIGQEELQSFCVRDGQGLVFLRKQGIKLAWISGRGCAATERRGRELGVEFMSLGCRDKAAELTRIQAQAGVTPADTLAMGDDLPDLALARGASFFSVPRGACRELRERADYVSQAAAGAGAVREVCELCLSARGLWDGLVEAAGR